MEDTQVGTQPTESKDETPASTEPKTEETAPSTRNEETHKNEVSAKMGIMARLFRIAENLSKKLEKLPDNHPLKKAINSIIGKITETQSKNSLLPPPIIPKESEKTSLLELKTKLGPEKWAKKAEKIKKNLKKLTVQAANISTKLLILSAKLAGKTVKWSGRTVKAVGYGIRTAAWIGKIASWGTEYSGKLLKLAGQGLESGGKALTNALSGTKFGAIFAPLSTGLTALGTGTKGLGTGTEKVGQAGNKFFTSVDNYGKTTVQTGNRIIQTGKKMENNANRMDNIRKYYKAKLLNHIQQRASNSMSPEQQRNLMRIKNPLAFEEMNKASQKSAQTVDPNIALLAKNSKRQK